MPHQQPHMVSFPVAGIHMVPQLNSCGQTRCKVRLTGLTRDHSGGSYRCEISSEAPTFRLASETRNVTVAGKKEEDYFSYFIARILLQKFYSIPNSIWGKSLYDLKVIL